MKCVEIFYKKEDAEKFFEEVHHVQWDTEPEIEETIDEDIDEKCWIVYFNPKPYRS